MPKNMKKYEEEGLVRVEIDMDFKTYAILLSLVEKSGYKVGIEKGPTSEGIRGVLTQGVLELYQKYVEDNQDKHNELDKINQQAYIFARRASAMKVNGISDKTIFATLQSKLPDYLKNHKVGKLLAKETMKHFQVASTFSSIELPEFRSGIKGLLKHRDVYKYFKTPTKKS